MILKTIEFVPTDISTTIDSLQSDITAGKYDDILINCCFLTFTEKGLTLVKQDKTIVTNATVDLSEYVKSSTLEKLYAKKSDIPSLVGYATETYVTEQINKIQIPDVSNFLTSIPSEYVTDTELSEKGYLTEHQSLENYVKKEDIPTLSFTDDGTLLVTIAGVTHQYAPIATT